MPDCADSAASPVVFSATVFPPVFGPLMTRDFFRAAQRERHRHDGAIFPPQLVFENGMPRINQTQFRDFGKLRHRRIEIARKAPARENTVKFGNGFGRSKQRTSNDLEALRQFTQNSYNLRRFILGKLDEFVIRLHSLKRLEEHGLPCSARAVHDSRNASPVLRAHGNHKPLIAQRDVIFSGLRIARSQDLLQRFLNRFARLRDARANAPQRLRRIVADLSIWQHASPDRRQHIPKVRQRGDARSQQRKFRRIFPELPAQPRGSLEERRGIQKLLRFENDSRPFDFLEPSLRVGQPAESQLAASAQPFPRLANQRKRRFESSAIRSKLQRIHCPAPWSARRPQPQQLPQLVKFEYVLCGPRHFVFFST